MLLYYIYSELLIAINRVRFIIIISCTLLVCGAHGFAVLVSTESIQDAHGNVHTMYYYYKSAVQDSECSYSKVERKVSVEVRS